MSRSPRFVARTLLLGVAAVVAVASLGGCKAPKSKRIAIAGPAVVAGGAVGLDVQNQNGGVKVVVDGSRSEAVVVARTRSGGRVVTEGENARAWIAAESVDQEGRSILRVLATPAEGIAEEPVDLVIFVPRCDGLTVRNAGGPVELVGVAGAVDVESGGAGRSGGWIRLRSDHAISSPVRLITDEGTIVCVVTPDSAGRVSMNAPHGSAKIFAPQTVLLGAQVSQTAISATLNGGSNDIVMHTANGDAQLIVREKPESYLTARMKP
ncbi:MAG: hypothetical protein DYG93_08075 [Leptolyngbya sp. PLA2]|nr:hypothetical protein [Leptolyngbya sp.]MCE7971605.1 hypothetical protein [Leptolyngbya sp. PL-A2]MCZ7632641.1 hypothetical protein [Phycisphaerales bacterium]MDL1904906.1 hypothetical protein [Synechococcales cyanobacterium CNB]GIK20223.1 MAG: hypothetical protein BroJett004_23870 [Planctomycetota bacterium]